jgi:hypothetical protein
MFPVHAMKACGGVCFSVVKHTQYRRMFLTQFSYRNWSRRLRHIPTSRAMSSFLKKSTKFVYGFM